jgi:hypothetical protein
MSILLHIHDIANAIQMAHNIISCGGTGKHSYTLQSVWLNKSYEETSCDCNSSMQTFRMHRVWNDVRESSGRIPRLLKGLNAVPVNRQEFPSRLNDCSVRR